MEKVKIVAEYWTQFYGRDALFLESEDGKFYQPLYAHQSVNPVGKEFYVNKMVEYKGKESDIEKIVKGESLP